jgi:ribosomal protein L7/L12
MKKTDVLRQNATIYGNLSCLLEQNADLTDENEELRNLVTSLDGTIEQLRFDVEAERRKAEEANEKLSKADAAKESSLEGVRIIAYGDPEIVREVNRQLNAGQKILAIKAVRAGVEKHVGNCGLKEAKLTVDNWDPPAV